MKIDRWLTVGHAAIDYSRPIRSSCAVSSPPLEPVLTYFYLPMGKVPHISHVRWRASIVTPRDFRTLYPKR